MVEVEMFGRDCQTRSGLVEMVFKTALRAGGSGIDVGCSCKPLHQ